MDARSPIMRREIAHWMGKGPAKIPPQWNPAHYLIRPQNESNITGRAADHDNLVSLGGVQGIASIRDTDLVQPIGQFLQPQRTEKNHNGVDLTRGAEVELGAIEIPDDRFALADPV
jgi:hypothetical protein